MKKIFLSFLTGAGLLVGGLALAQTGASEIVFPVAELGNCESKTACFAYCDLPENGRVCFEFAKKHRLLPAEELRLAEKVHGVTGGPGGCTSKISCENFCNDITNIDTCLAFAEENGLMKVRELEEAKKVRAAIQSGRKLPGDCRNKTACENYCKNPVHVDECFAFAEAAGFLPPEELEHAKKFLPLMKSGQTPGACKSKNECEQYCEADNHFEECLSFAEKHGMIPEEERKHIEAFRKNGGKGPGGCKGRQCQAFCESPKNQEACFNWARDNGLMKKEDIRRVEEGRKHIEKVFEDAPEEVRGCIEEALGPGGLERMRSGGFFGGQAVGEKIRACFEGFMSQMGGTFGGPNGEHGGPMGSDFSGPGGCKGPEECMSYCKDHPEECRNFAPPSGGIPGGEHGNFGGGGPGRCKTPEECHSFCESNPKECQGFGPQSGGQSEFPPTQGFPTPEQFRKHGDSPTPPEGYEKGFPIPAPGEFPAESPEGIQAGPPKSESFGRQQQIEDQYRQQYEQQYRQEFQITPPPEFQQPTPQSSLPHPFALILAPFVELLR